MISPIDILGLSEAKGSWNIIWIFFLNGINSFGDNFVKSLSSNITFPFVGCVRPIMLRPVVDFPHPLSPTRPKVSPAWREKDTFSTACTEPVIFPKPSLIGNLVVKPLTSSKGSSSLRTVSFVDTSFLLLFSSLTISPSALLISTLGNLAGSFLPFMLPNLGTADKRAFV